jgi:hypothetical protein
MILLMPIKFKMDVDKDATEKARKLDVENA